MENDDQEALATEKRELKSAQNARQFYVEKIKAFESRMRPDVFNVKSIFDLQSDMQRLQALVENLETKSLNLNCLDGTAAIGNEDEELEALSNVWKSSIARRIFEIEQFAEKQRAIEEQDSLAQNACAQLKPVENVHQPVQATSEQKKTNTWGKFDGDICQWRQFQSEFKGKVHENDKLDIDTKKMLLNQALPGKTREAISNAENSYEKMWVKLHDVFDRAYMQMHFCLQKINAIPNLVHATAKSLGMLLSRADECVEILNAAINDTKYSPLLTIMLVNKLDKETTRAWERHRASLADSWAKVENEGENRSAL